MSTASASPETPNTAAVLRISGDRAAMLDNNTRMARYKVFSVAFAYPEDTFFSLLPELAPEKDALITAYDRIFRTGAVWLYGAEHLAKNEFQRVDCLADINGFYRAFGLQPASDRPDALATELEFMYYLIHKWCRAMADGRTEDADICIDAQRKFFGAHLFPGAQHIAQAIMTVSTDGFYAIVASELLVFLSREHELLGTPVSLRPEN